MKHGTALQSVVFQVLGTLCGKSIGVVTLNMEKALNALNIEMVESMTHQLKQWQRDDDIACVVLDGAGEKAFCAGGDVRAIHRAANQTPGQITDEAVTFFTKEYQLDYLLHRYGKPVLVWGDGIVMGGGLGLMAGASHRVVTERSRIAMPEVTIGLYPDVGGSYFLNRMPGKTGIFLGMTAYNLNAADACYVDIGNHYMNASDKELMLDAMAELDWHGDIKANHQALHQLLHQMETKAQDKLGDSQLQKQQALIDKLMSGSVTDIITRMQSLETDLDWLSRSKKTLLAGSPISWHLVAAQAKLGTDLSLEQVFQQELAMSVNCCAIADFREGVRALLIDKDRNPHWKYDSADAVPEALIAQIMASPWPTNLHPLKNLAAGE